VQSLHWYVLGRNSFESMVYISALIKEKMKERRLSAAAFAKLINTDLNNIYNIFSRQSMDTELLFSISIALEHDFFQYYKPLGRLSFDTDMPQEITVSTEWMQHRFKEVIEKIESLNR
jgi:hypothetical protein